MAEGTKPPREPLLTNDDDEHEVADQPGDGQGQREPIDNQRHMVTPDQTPHRTPDRVRVELEDVVTAAVRAIEINDRRQTRMSDYSTLIPRFGGEENEDVERWFARVDAVQNTYQVPSHQLVLILVAKLDGSALQWFHSRAEHATFSLGQFRQAIVSMFMVREDTLTLMRKFQARKWKKTERFHTYFNDKVLMANKLGLSEADTITYTIEGFDNPQLQIQAKLKEFTTLNHLLRLMNDISSVERQTTATANTSGQQRRTTNRTPAIIPPGSQPPAGGTSTVRCYNCNEVGHVMSTCRKPKRPKGSCFSCGEMGHMQRNCPRNRRPESDVRMEPDTTTLLIEEKPVVPPYELDVSCQIQGQCEYMKIRAILDTGSPISLWCESLAGLPLLPVGTNKTFSGINGSRLNLLGRCVKNLIINHVEFNFEFYVVPDSAIPYTCLLGRDFIANSACTILLSDTVNIIPKTETDQQSELFTNPLLLIDESVNDCMDFPLSIEPTLSWESKQQVLDSYQEWYEDAVRPELPSCPFEMEVKLKPNQKPFSFSPRRLSYFENEQVDKIIKDLLSQGVIKPSTSEYSSRIVLVPKKDGNLRMCVDFRELNKQVLRENFPLPVIEEQIERLSGRKWFTKLDLRSAFHHVKVRSDCTKYFSFVTPFGQFEYCKMPFGFCNSPSIFMRFVTTIFRDLLESNKLLIYLDDLLIATSTYEENLDILKEVLKRLVDNCLTLRLDKCSFLHKQIEYLGYTVNNQGVRPNDDHIACIKEYPIPKNKRELQSFIGLVSYFRKFIKDFSLIAKPLYDQLRKSAEFSFGVKELDAFEQLRGLLMSKPTLALYSPLRETELHCDASKHGFGSILLQRQDDGKFHPVFYFSKRTTDAESRYHSYELETLAIINAIKRFRVYLHHIKFKLVTDCDSFRLTMDKQNIVPRIARWALFLQDYNFTVEHRPNRRMSHADALSRCHNILVLEEASFERVLAVKQQTDPEIVSIREKLEQQQLPFYELRNGLVYRKDSKKQLLFYVPCDMVSNIIRSSHDKLGHIGAEKTCDIILRTYWFPNLRDRVKRYISNCLKCLNYQPDYGKKEGVLHCIPKGKVPWDTLHVDHLGPLTKCGNRDKFVLLIVDGFTKFVKLFACRTTNTKEAIKHLKHYFQMYSKPKRLVSDRGTGLKSEPFKSFLKEQDIQHHLVAVRTPRANGQVERVNRVLVPMLAKLDASEGKWNKHLAQVEYAINNTCSKTTGEAPSRLLFGVYQRGTVQDDLKRYLEDAELNSETVNLEQIRDEAAEKTSKSQAYNKQYFDAHHKRPRVFKKGDMVLIPNIEVTPEISKKLLPKFKGPYIVHSELPNDRYIVRDIEGHQVTQLPYDGVLESSQLRPWNAGDTC